jgi:hypothetical protein
LSKNLTGPKFAGGMKKITIFPCGSSSSLISKLTELPNHKAVTVKLVLDSIYEVGVYYSNESKDFQDSLMYIVSNNEVALTRKQTLFDKEKLNRFYQNLGYADFNVISVNSQLSQNKLKFYILAFRYKILPAKNLYLKTSIKNTRNKMGR